MKKGRILGTVGALTCFTASIWWMAWCVHSLKGWTALPLMVTGAVLFLAGVAVFLEISMRPDDE